ncbi:hypothetical protein JXJ21_11040 [candidate division KSB1 bacterium]|nr:hypothetical protein [candidate division KSB1 bacterium]
MRVIHFLLILLPLSCLIIACGGDADKQSEGQPSESMTEDTETTEFVEASLTDGIMTHYISVHQKFIESAKEAGEDYGKVEDKDNILSTLQGMRIGRRLGKRYQEILESEDFSPEKFDRVHRTVTEIWGLLWQQEVSHAMGGSEGLGGLADKSIEMMESMLKNPNLDDETKKNLETQIKEARDNREELKKTQQEQEQRLEKFNTKNVALVKKYMPELMQAWGFKGEEEKPL